ncbi:polysaccharide pyruvyl transferase CsaB [Paenibacillus aurantius]|uniref:Polysaccharide pyruvyl transferase CsaB n=1 Tax=Paenibacillus aurantius TaxID=2918900 RepID=A0AA96LHK8_9BACL|nr:polysaccharide pyruvyl transferase CsaB [Paenibacillus aurantius]WNQ11582.1 polysaccharide pyruvyl transferase CsaB [Paenibacillus aurantius]
MDRRIKKIVISGYYGFHNSGDEAVLQSILLALESEGEKQGIRIEPIVLSGDPAWTEETYKVKAVHRMKMGRVLSAIRSSDGLVSGGGSLLQDATGRMTIPYYLGILNLAQWLGKPTFVYSQGIGPVNRSSYFPWIRRVFAKSRYVSVRDVESAQLLKRMGLARDAEVVPDPVMGLPLRGVPLSAEADLPTVGVSVRFWNEDRSELEGLARSLDRLVEAKQVKIRFLPFHLPSDVEASREVIKRMKKAGKAILEVAEGVEHPQDMLAEVSACSLLIGMRLHSLIYAASQSVPLIGISYDPKIDQFLNRLGMKAAASVTGFDSDGLAAEAVRVLENKTQWAEEKREAIERLKREAQRPAREIAAFLTNER